MRKQTGPSSISMCIFAAMLLSGCNDSSNPVLLPPLITPVSFPYIDGNTLYEYNPDTGESAALASSNTSSNKSLLIALDTDKTKPSRDENNDPYLSHTALPEFVAYVVGQKLWLFDLSTRKDHMLFNFGIEDKTLDAPYICDLNKAISIDFNSFRDRVELLKDETAVFVKSSDTESCDSTSNFSYSRIIITESRTDTFVIRRNKLITHEHGHNHEHTHEDENTPIHDPHESAVEFTHTDDHEHEHSHDLGNEHEEGHAHSQSHQDDHQNPKNLEILTETLPVLVGKFRIAEEALMYAGPPIVDVDNQQFGFLGFDSKSSIYKFFVADNGSLEREDELDKMELWTLSSTDFLTSPEPETPQNQDRLFPTVTRSPNQLRLPESILIEHNWKIMQLFYIDFFDDDRDAERDYSVANPLFVRTIDPDPDSTYSNAYLRYNNASRRFAIKDLDDIYIVRTDEAPSLPHIPLRTMDDAGLSFYDFELLQTNVIATKNYSGDLALTEIGIPSGLERTLIANTSELFSTQTISSGGLYTTQEDPLNNSYKAQLILDNLTIQFPGALTPAIWTSVYDASTNVLIDNSPPVYPGILSKDVPEMPESGGTGTVITDPNLVLAAGNTSNLREDLPGNQIPTTVNAVVEGAFIFNSHYGYIKVKETEDTMSAKAPTRVYYFDPSDFGDMKFMYEETAN